MSEEFLIVDCGSGFTRCGYSGESSPRLIFPSIIEVNESKKSKKLVGNDALKNCRIGSTRGLINENLDYESWDDYSDQMNYIFKEMNVKSKETSVFIVEKALEKKNNRDHFIQILFEEFQIRRFACQIAQVCSFTLTGQTTGIVCDMGENLTFCVPIYEFYPLPHAIHIIKDCGGKFVRNELSKILSSEHEPNLVLEPSTTPLHGEILDDIFRRNSHRVKLYKASKQNKIFNHDNIIRYKLPCGNMVNIREELLTQSVENLLDKEQVQYGWCYGVRRKFKTTEVSYEVAMKCDLDVRKSLLERIYLTGGFTRTQGLGEIIRHDTMNRIKHHWNHVSPTDQPFDINVRFCTDELEGQPELSAFVGASVLSSFVCNSDDKSLLERISMTEDEYDEYGPSLMRRRFFHVT